MAVVARGITITWASLTIGGTSETYMPTGVHRLSRDFEDATLTQDVLARGTTAGNYKTAVDGLQAAAGVRDGTLVVTISSQVIAGCNPTSGTGFGGRLQVEKLGSDIDGPTQGMYRLVWRWKVPAGQAEGRRQSADVTVTYDASRLRTLRLSTVYTAGGGSTAKANHDAGIAAYASAVLSAYGMTSSRLVSEVLGPGDDDDAAFSATREYRELTPGYTTGALATAGVIDPSLTVSRSRYAPGDYVGADGRAQRLDRVTARFACSVDVGVTTDLSGLWETIRGGIVDAIRQAFSGSSGFFALVSEAPQFDEIGNRISASYMALTGPGPLLEQSYSQSISEMPGQVVVPVIAADAFSGVAFSGPGRWHETVTISRREISSDTGPSGQFIGLVDAWLGILGGLIPQGGGPFASQGGFRFGFRLPSGAGGAAGGGSSPPPDVVLLSTSTSRRPQSMGLDGYSIDTVRSTVTTNIQRYRAVTAGALGSGGAPLPGTDFGGRVATGGGR